MNAVAAEFDKTSFGIQRRARDTELLLKMRGEMQNRVEFTKDSVKRSRIHALIYAIDAVLEDLKN